MPSEVFSEQRPRNHQKIDNHCCTSPFNPAGGYGVISLTTVSSICMESGVEVDRSLAVLSLVILLRTTYKQQSTYIQKHTDPRNWKIYCLWGHGFMVLVLLHVHLTENNVCAWSLEVTATKALPLALLLPSLSTSLPAFSSFSCSYFLMLLSLWITRSTTTAFFCFFPVRQPAQCLFGYPSTVSQTGLGNPTISLLFCSPPLL